MDKKKKLPESVTLDDGRVITKKRAKVRDLSNAKNLPKGKEYLEEYALMANKILVDGKPIVVEQLLDDFYEDDLEKICSLFVDEDDLKNV
jgi:hypothetical protein